MIETVGMEKTRFSDNDGLLGPGDQPAVQIAGPETGSSPFVLLGDHAGDAIPCSLGDLGLSSADRARHIAVDIGSRSLGLELSQRLGAPFVSQAYSRLVIDCNRAPERADAVPEVSDGSPVPGNQALGQPGRDARIAAVHEAYHAAIARLLDERARAGMETVLVSVHSFTPVFAGSERPWDIGVLHQDNAFALDVFEHLKTRARLVIGDNEPYRFDATDYTIPRHAFPRRLDWVELEIRQDLLAEPDGPSRIADMLVGALQDSNPFRA